MTCTVAHDFPLAFHPVNWCKHYDSGAECRMSSMLMWSHLTRHLGHLNLSWPSRNVSSRCSEQLLHVFFSSTGYMKMTAAFLFLTQALGTLGTDIQFTGDKYCRFSSVCLDLNTPLHLQFLMIMSWFKVLWSENLFFLYKVNFIFLELCNMRQINTMQCFLYCFSLITSAYWISFQLNSVLISALQITVSIWNCFMLENNTPE